MEPFQRTLGLMIRRQWTFLSVSILALLAVLAPFSAPVHAQEEAAPVTRKRLATILARYGNEVLVSVDLNVGGMGVAFELLKASGELDPTEPATWRKLIALALRRCSSDTSSSPTENTSAAVAR